MRALRREVHGYVLAGAQGIGGDRGVPVLGRGGDDGVNLLVLQQAAACDFAWQKRAARLR
jgi:hypothetical protein